MSNFKKAFNCKKCPKRNDEDGCPMWWEVPLEDATNPSKTAIAKGCGYQMMPLMFQMVTKAAWTQAETVQEMRTEVNEGIGRAAAAVLLEAKNQAPRLGTTEVELIEED